MKGRADGGIGVRKPGTVTGHAFDASTYRARLLTIVDLSFLDTPSGLAYYPCEKEARMDFFSPVVGAVTGVGVAQWKDILIFTLKVFAFTVPFVAVGLLFEKDHRARLLSRVTRSVLVLMFTLPVFLFGLFNFFAPGLPESFWARYPLLEGLWIMEGTWPPVVLSGLALLYFILCIAENVRGDLTN